MTSFGVVLSRRVVSLVAVGLLAACAVFTAAPAVAAERASSVVVTGDDNFLPSPNKWRAWMIATTSSVLGKFTPNSWRREQIANSVKYDYSFELWNHQMGIDGVRYNDQGQMVGMKYTNRAQGTYQDVVIAGLEEKFNDAKAAFQAKKNQAAIMGKKPSFFRVPATGAKALARGAGSALAYVTAFEMGSVLGAQGTNLVGSWLGVDTNGQVCAAFGRDLGGQAVRFLSGQDCSSFDAYIDSYDANGDVPAVLSFGSVPVRAVYIPSGTGVGTDLIVCGDNGVLTAGVTAPAGYSKYVEYSYSDGVVSGNYSWQRWTNSYCGNPGYYSNYRGGGGLAGVTVVGGRVKLVDSSGNSTVAQTATLADSDPDRTLSCVVTYTDGSTQSQAGSTYRESSGALSMPDCPATPAGKTPSQVAVNENVAAPGGSVTNPLYTQPVTDEYKAWWQAYPECRDGACGLDLIRKSDGASCFDLDAGCPGWFAEPSKENTYQCRYGTHDVSITECSIYSGLFEPGRVSAGSPYSDPDTGQWSGGQTSPKGADVAMGTQIQDPASVRTCNLDGIGFDPVGWVIRPIQCVMQWGFVPRKAVVEADFAGAGEAWEGKPPQVIGSFVGSLSLTPEAQGCSRPVTLFGVTFDILNSCPGSPIATITPISRLVVNLSIVALVIVVLRRQIASQVGLGGGQG